MAKRVAHMNSARCFAQSCDSDFMQNALGEIRDHDALFEGGAVARREVEAKLSHVSASLQEAFRRGHEEAVWDIAGEPSACAAIPSDDLVSDEQDFMRLKNGLKLGPITS